MEDYASTSKSVKVIKKHKTKSSRDSDSKINQIESQFKELELNRLKHTKVNPTSLTKNWYSRLTPPADIQYERKKFSKSIFSFFR